MQVIDNIQHYTVEKLHYST